MMSTRSILQTFHLASGVLTSYQPTCNLLTGVLKANQISQLDVSFEPFPAHAGWDCSKKRVIIGSSFNDIHDLAVLILFECCNGLQTKSFLEIQKRAAEDLLNKPGYTEEIERAEYKSEQLCSYLVSQAVRDRVFPPTIDRQYCLPTFEIYYKLQQLMGHSQRVAAGFDELNPKGKEQVYCGTWEPPVLPSDEACIKHLFFLKYHRMPFNEAAHDQALRQSLFDLEKRDDDQAKRILEVAKKNFLEVSDFLLIEPTQMDLRPSAEERKMFFEVESGNKNLVKRRKKKGRIFRGRFLLQKASELSISFRRKV
jgi:hypothetical protein